MAAQASMATVLEKHHAEIRSAWLEQLSAGGGDHSGRIAREDLRRQADEFLQLISRGLRAGQTDGIEGEEWADMRAFLENLSEQRALAGFTADETAKLHFLVSSGRSSRRSDEAGKDAGYWRKEIWAATELLDSLGLHTVKSFQRRAKSSSAASSRSCWSSRRRWSSCGRASWRCR